MSTRSMIGILKDGQIKAIYCHSDGYIDYNGRLLFEKHNTPEKALNLVNMGQRSYLDEVDIKEGIYEGEKKQFAYFDEIDDYADVEEFNYFFDMRDNEWYCMSKWHFMDREPHKLDDLLHTKEGQDLAVKIYTEDAKESYRKLLADTKRDPDWYGFECDIDLSNINNSLLIDSGTLVARFTDDKYIASLEVQGSVKVDFKGERYTCASDFPKELKDIIIEASKSINYYDYLADRDVDIIDNNWFEVFIEDKNGMLLLSQCDDFENESPEDIKEDLKEWIETYVRKEPAYEADEIERD